MKSLYDENARYTDVAEELSRKTLVATQEIMQLYVAYGYSPREIGQIMEAAIRDEMLLTIIGWKND